MSYRVKLEIFEGPLDLLIYLIKKNDIDIYDIPIASITEQYMEYIEMMKILDLDFVGDFLVMAATLLQIKSRMLLPPDPSSQQAQEDPRDELVRRLQEYQVFKEIAERLKIKETERQKLFTRHIDEEAARDLKEDAKEVYFEANLFDLINAFTKALKRFKEHTVYEVESETYTVEQKIHEILHALLNRPQIFLMDFFEVAKCKLEIIVTFMAILELIRLKEIKVLQKRMFSEIEVLRNKDNVLPAEKE